MVTVIAFHVFLLAWGALLHGPTIDEIGHLPAGLSHWHFNRFDLYNVNPPLVRSVAAIPVLISGAETDWSSYTTEQDRRLEWPVGEDFLRANGERSYWYFTLAR